MNGFGSMKKSECRFHCAEIACTMGWHTTGVSGTMHDLHGFIQLRGTGK